MTKEEAVSLYNSGWWKDKTPEETAEFQLNEEKLCCPFEVFHEAVEKYLGRPVWTHEFADFQRLLDEKNGKVIPEDPLTSLRRIAGDRPIIVV